MPGFGRRLLEYGAEHYGIREVTVNEQNPQAVGFYEHMGWVNPNGYRVRAGEENQLYMEKRK